ncbi:MAG: FAD-dependent pyridine nucleotide-disulfide oxidoreductase [Clostridiales bacterium]|jgi:nitrite reductase (NADH) large subunit|nr:FAD-dependent pyridine nucleotide-disulfide oxidoreductase [Clostridiales bacterium]
MEKVTIIGGGIAGLTAAETIRKSNSEVKISIITDEEYYPYSRIKLSKYINSYINFEDLYIHKQSWYEDMNINIITSRSVEKINSSSKEVTLDNGDVLSYNRLIIASGGYNFIPPFPNVNLKGVFSVRNIHDIKQIQGHIKENQVKKVGIIGGGLLGIEAAWGLKSSGDFNISIIETAPRLLPRQLDEEGSLILEKLINDNGITVYKGDGVKEISGEGLVSGIELNSGTMVEAELVIVSTGIRSNLSLAKDIDIPVNRGIVVDKYMKTNNEDIFAAGDCAEYNGMVYGIWPVATEQGKIAGLNAIGIREGYKEIVPSNMLQVMGINVFSTGDISEGSSVIKYDNGLYTKLFIKDNSICGAILIGDTKKGFALKKAIEEKRDFSREISENINLLSII